MLSWLVPSFVALIALIVGALEYRHVRRDKRIDDFIDNFFAKYEGAGVVLELLVPCGINNLKNHKEIKTALKQLQNRLGFHPLRRWNVDIEKIGYKTFFATVVVRFNGILDSNKIEKYIKLIHSGGVYVVKK